MKTAYVICINDSVEHVVIDDDQLAEKKLAELKAAYWERNKWSFRDLESYEAICYWHIHTVDAE